MRKQHILNVIIYMKHANITTCMMLACGTNNFFGVMMHRLLHETSTMHLQMKFGSPHFA
jgi:hypothetical protein